MKRPPGTVWLLRKMKKQLQELAPAPPKPKLEDLGPFNRADRCLGCGKVGTYLCRHCRELHIAAVNHVNKVWATVEARFAQRRS